MNPLVTDGPGWARGVFLLAGPVVDTFHFNIYDKKDARTSYSLGNYQGEFQRFILPLLPYVTKQFFRKLDMKEAIDARLMISM